MQLNSILTKAIQNTIFKIDLIDTGELLRSAQVYTFYRGSDLIIEVLSKDYIKYHIYSKDITDVFLGQPGVNEEINKLLIPKIQQNVEDYLNGKEVNLNPSVYVSYNEKIM